MNQENKHGIKLGIFIFTGLVFFVAGVLAIGNINKSFTKTIEISTVFNEVNGLQPGANVWVSGVKVGTVKEMRFIKNADVEVIMKIETKSREFIPKNAKAKISSDGLIGSKIIVIYGGTPDAGPIESNDQLAFENTYSTGDMIDMLQENNKNLLSITSDFKAISNNMADGEGTLGKLLADESLYDAFQSTIDKLDRAAAYAEKLTASVNEYAAKLNTTGGLAYDLAADTTVFNHIQASVTSFQSAAETTVKVADNLKITTDGLNQNDNTPVGVLLHDEQAAESLKTSIHNLEVSTEKLNESMEALQHSFLLRGFFKKKNKEENQSK